MRFSFDEYELKARAAPGLIVALPVLADILLVVPVVANWQMFTTTSVVGLALIYALGRIAQARGEAIEKKLWASWDGAPSTRFLRHRDSTFGKELKDSIRQAVERQLTAKLPSIEEETDNPQRADQTSFDVFRRVRQFLRQRDPQGLWHRHNIEYGFFRNLLGCRLVWLVISILTTAIALFYGWRKESGVLNAATIIGLVSMVSAIFVGWGILPAATRRSAENYAESAWMAFLHVSQPDTAASSHASKSSIRSQHGNESVKSL